MELAANNHLTLGARNGRLRENRESVLA
jgi:hypothetical protein